MKLYVCFLWHMHQPYYKDPETGTFILPWVRLHAIKDYVALPRIFRDFPAVRHTFNLVPSLLVQVRDYVEGGAEDAFLAVSRKNALDLDGEEETFILRNFFSAFAPTMIAPQPRYADLYARRESALRAVGKPGAPGGFGASEYTDLVTLFNLTWFHPIHREEDADLARLWRKGRGYTEREKALVLDRQIDIMAEVIPEYRKFLDEGRGELSSTPMYHPILPLLVDNRSAQDACPGAALPNVPFASPADAVEQLRRGREEFMRMFGRYPAGLWPSEGSVSPPVLEMASRAGFSWTATDEILLSRVLGAAVRRDAQGVPVEPEWLYHPYLANTPGGSLGVFFRDHHLSDLIGFEYSRWDASDAANNFVHHLRLIYDRLAAVPAPARREAYVVPVILDGENAWEYYHDSGRIFLRFLLERLTALAPDISCITFSEALHVLNYRVPLPSLPTGSWIDGTFNIWIGHPEDRAAWEMLARARSRWHARHEELRKAGQKDSPALSEAYEHLLVAEGSDWCWWYGDDHFTPHAAEFDRLFRHQVKAVYRALGETPPDNLDIPIIRPDRMPAGRNYLASPRNYIRPTIDGKVTSYFEWSAATPYRPSPEFGAMHRSGYGMLATLYYGFDATRLFLRVDFHDSVFESTVPVNIEFIFTSKNRKIGVTIPRDASPVSLSLRPIDEPPDGAGGPSAPQVPEGLEAAFDKVLEIGIPFRHLECADDDRIEFVLTLNHVGSIGERWPMYGIFTAELPGKDFEERMWEA
ncbi:MAG: glycoside hydrolase [Gemmatimonadota bacterium]